MRHVPSRGNSDGGVTFKSNSDGDPEYDVKKLMDWNGDWLPPPEEWSARRGYASRHFGQMIEQWVDKECTGTMDIDVPAFNAFKITADKLEVEHDSGAVTYKEIVPRYWAEFKVEDKTLHQYLKDMTKQAPDALSDIDILEDLPWWDRYENDTSCYLNGLEAPEAKFDYSDTEHPVAHIELASTEDKINGLMHARYIKERKIVAKRNRPLPEPKHSRPKIEDRRIRLETNVYLRPVQPADVVGIAVSLQPRLRGP